MDVDQLASLIENFIEENVHMAQRLYPDVWAKKLAEHILKGG